ncbi:hypothetical protein KR009_012141, partial [Drosophila setifemur]
QATMTRTTETTFTVRTMTGRRVSKLSAILMICFALLLTKSCGIVALSGDLEINAGGSGQELAQAELWSDTTTTKDLEEGSGWQSTLPADDTTESSTDLPNESTTVPEETETTTTAIADDNTTETDEETTSIGEESTTTGSGDNEAATTIEQESSSASDSSSPATETSTPAQETTTAAPSTSSAALETSSQETSSSPAPESSSSSAPESSSSSEATTIAVTPPTFQCQAAGLFPHISGDCRRYHNCLFNPLLRQLQEIELVCPPLTVFSPSLSRCGRDIAECLEDTFQCPRVGRFAGHDDTYYYSCMASLQGSFHKFVVRCSSGQRFDALIGGCYRYDWSQLVPGQEATEISDLAAIKRELKQNKLDEKLRLKAQKQQEKLAKKQQKLEEKAAKKAAKEQAKQQAKAEKDKAKGESIESPESAE